MGDSYRILKIKDRLNWEEIPVLDVDKVLWMEFFFSVDSGKTYFNFEINPNGCITVQFGPSPKDRMYKCGDRTARRHYLSWAPVHSETPNFHRPQDFQKADFVES